MHPRLFTPVRSKLFAQEPSTIFHEVVALVPQTFFRNFSTQTVALIYHGRRARRNYHRDVWGRPINKVLEKPNYDAGLTQDQVIQKALGFYKINWKPTQPPSSLKLPHQPAPSPPKLPDGTISPDFYNRNPRNMELMNFDMKQEGWALEADRKDFYNKLVFERTSAYTRAGIMHSSGRMVVSASTEEFAVAKHLYRTTDVSAAENIGRILARRMLETGLTSVCSTFSEEDRKAPKIAAFLSGLTEAGIQLQEQNRIKVPELAMGASRKTVPPGK